jgi:hypothetical protein
MKKLFFIILLITPFVAFAQTDYKQVYDKSLEYQISSSVGAIDDFWKFHPDWYYAIFHSKYKSGDYQNNNKIYLDSIVEATRESMLKVLQARNDIEIIYQHELAHWNDRNNDWESADLQSQLDDARQGIGYVFEEFPNHQVDLNDATKFYNELERIDNKINTLKKAHLDNAKRRQGFEKCLEEYFVLLNVSFKYLNMSFVGSKNQKLNPNENPNIYEELSIQLK